MQSLWILVASLMFAFMGATVKLASYYYSVSEIVFARGLISTIIIYVLMKRQGGTLKTKYMKDHVVRGFIGVTSQSLWFYSFTLLPIAMATTLNYTSSIWLAAFLFVLAFIKKQKKFEWGLVFTIILSFIGVALILKPSVDPDQFFGGVIALISSIINAAVFLQVRKLGLLGEPEYRVVFYFSLISTIVGLAGSLMSGHLPFVHNIHAMGLLYVLITGVTAAIAQMTMTRAYRLGAPLVVANLQYSGIIFTSILGFIIWKDSIDGLGWLGIAIIILSGVISTYYKVKASHIHKASPS